MTDTNHSLAAESAKIVDATLTMHDNISVERLLAWAAPKSITWSDLRDGDEYDVLLSFAPTGVALANWTENSTASRGVLPLDAVDGGWRFEGSLASSALLRFNSSLSGLVRAVNATAVTFTFRKSLVLFNISVPIALQLRIRAHALTQQVSFVSCRIPPTSLAVELRVGAPRTEVETRSSASTTASTTAAVGAAVSVAAMNPTAAVQMARMGALQEISACIVASDKGQMPIGFTGGSFTAMEIGDSSGRYLRGGLVGNGLIVAAGTLLLAAVVATWSLMERARRISQHQQEVTPVVTSSVESNAFDNANTAVSTARSTPDSHISAVLGAALQQGRLPSVYYPVFMVFAPPMIGFGISLVFLTPATGVNVVLGATGVLALVVYAGAVTWNLKTRFCCRLEPVKRTRPVLVWLTWLCAPEVHWVSDGEEHEAWRRRNRLYFDDYNLWWYGLLDLWSSVIIGVVNGISVSSREICAAQIAIVLLVFLVVFVLGVWLDPCTSRSLRYYLNFSNALGFISSCLLVAGIRLDNARLIDYSSWIMTVVSVVSILKLLVDVLYVFFRFIRTFSSDHTISFSSSNHEMSKSLLDQALCSGHGAVTAKEAEAAINKAMDVILDELILSVDPSCSAPSPSMPSFTTVPLQVGGALYEHGREQNHEMRTIDRSAVLLRSPTILQPAAPPPSRPDGGDLCDSPFPRPLDIAHQQLEMSTSMQRRPLNWDPFADVSSDELEDDVASQRLAANLPVAAQTMKMEDSDDDPFDDL
jgi:hypothetical protein